jgi:hypothetical protein
VNEEVRRMLSPSVLEVVERTEGFAATLVGMDETIARATAEVAGFAIRIRQRDAESFVLRMDFQPSRLNLTIHGGIVTTAEVF